MTKKYIPTFDEHINEGYNFKSMEKELMKAFTVQIVPNSILVKEYDDESLSFLARMDNGDKVDFSSYHQEMEASSEDHDELRINGKVFKMNGDEMNSNYIGALEAYQRYLNNK